MGERGLGGARGIINIVYCRIKWKRQSYFFFQMEVVETSFHSRLIGALPSHQSLETKQKGTAELVKHNHGARTSGAGEAG